MALPTHNPMTAPPGTAGRTAPPACRVMRLRLTDFRNYASLSLDLDARPVVLTGSNGAGKTNLLEAVSLIAPGRGLRQAAYGEMARLGGDGGWAVAAHIAGPDGEIDIGTGIRPSGAGETGARLVHVNGEARKGTAALGADFRCLWLTPAMDGLFTGPAADRRRFLDRLVTSLDPTHRTRLNAFEKAMRQRNRLLDEAPGETVWLDALEMQMAESGVAVAAARLQAVARLERAIASGRSSASPFPWAGLFLEGALEESLKDKPAIDAEDAYRQTLAGARRRDAAARRTLEGPHRSDFIVSHGPKAMPARSSSTGEQKALLIGLVLAHGALVKDEHSGFAPVILLDEIAAHLDEARRLALFEEILQIGSQAWVTGTDRAVFAPLGEEAQYYAVGEGAANG